MKLTIFMSIKTLLWDVRERFLWNVLKKNPSWNQINEKNFILSILSAWEEKENVICCQNDSRSRTSYINAIIELMACYFVQFTKSLFNASFFFFFLLLLSPLHHQPQRTLIVFTFEYTIVLRVFKCLQLEWIQRIVKKEIEKSLLE